MRPHPSRPIRSLFLRPSAPAGSCRALATALMALAILAVVIPAAAAPGVPGVVNINEAGASQLTLLPRVGPALAQRILDHREASGPFEAEEDLMLVRGIGEKTFELLEPLVTLEGPTTLTTKVGPKDAAELVERLRGGGSGEGKPSEGSKGSEGSKKDGAGAGADREAQPGR